MTIGIYKIQHKETGRLYIGSSSNVERRLYVHRIRLNGDIHHSKSLQNAWHKYGEDAFDFLLILICLKEDLIMYEQLVMDGYQSHVKPYGYNIRKIAESNAGLPAHPNTVAASKKNWQNPDFKERMRRLNIERLKDPIFKKKLIDASIKARKDNPEIEKRRKNAASVANSLRCKGVPLKKEHIEKMRQTKLRKFASGELIAKKTHGMTDSPEYSSWRNMLSRCNNPNDAKYKTTGALGVKVCATWEKDFMQFYMDMGCKPDGMALGRRNVRKNYDKENCQWSTPKMLSSGRKMCIKVLLNGVETPIMEAAKQLGRHSTAIQQRARDFGVTRQEATDYFVKNRKISK